MLVQVREYLKEYEKQVPHLFTPVSSSVLFTLSLG